MASAQNAHPIVYEFQPLGDSRWTSFLERHPQASIFHTPAWLQSLHLTYGYHPTALTLTPPDSPLQSAIAACAVNSWLTGSRLVSMPFADHCQPLLREPSELPAYSAYIAQRLSPERWRYAEFRPVQPLGDPPANLQPSGSYWLHQLDLEPDIGTLFRNLHKQSTQRKVHRAEREGLIYEEGCSESHLTHFYRLLMLTRQRHGLPPQPKNWFRNLAGCFGQHLKIRLAMTGRQAVASILTIQFKDTLVYKYGGSDPRFHNLGAMHLLFWKAIEEAKGLGLRVFDLGRSDRDDPGLITFKDRWGAGRQEIRYYRCCAGGKAQPQRRRRAASFSKVATGILPRLPGGLLRAVGTFLYRHMG